MRAFLFRLATLALIPHAQGVVGILLFLTGGVEVIAPFLDEIQGNETKLGSQHGITLFGIYMMLRSVGEIVKGSMEIQEGMKRVEGRGEGKGEEQGKDQAA